MVAQPTIAEPETIESQQNHLRRYWLANARVADYWSVTKPEVNFLIVITTFAGFWRASSDRFHHFPFMLLSHTLLGTLLVASGAGTLNQYIERRFDAQMRRTARRPVASGRLNSPTALRFGILLSFTGCTYLALLVNDLRAGLRSSRSRATYSSTRRSNEKHRYARLSVSFPALLLR
jgi:heme O synthase-like polyprenyltransferase